jgi:hypothetical protein
MLSFLLSLFISAAQAQNIPVITAPSGIVIAPTAAQAVTGISVTVAGATALTQFTISYSCNGAVLTATASGAPLPAVSGSGTSALSIGPATAIPLNATLATVKVAWPTAVLNANDVCHINAVSGGQNAAPVAYAVRVDGNKYLLQSSAATAQARSQQQCLALAKPCDGTFSKYWWEVKTTTNGQGAIQIRPGDPQYDATCTGTCPGGAASIGVGLSAGEQSSLVPVTGVALPVPTPAAGTQ